MGPWERIGLKARWEILDFLRCLDGEKSTFSKNPKKLYIGFLGVLNTFSGTKTMFKHVFGVKNWFLEKSILGRFWPYNPIFGIAIQPHSSTEMSYRALRCLKRFLHPEL